MRSEGAQRGALLRGDHRLYHQEAVGALAGPALAHLSCERASIAIDLTGETKWSGDSALMIACPAQEGL